MFNLNLQGIDFSWYQVMSEEHDVQEQNSKQIIETNSTAPGPIGVLLDTEKDFSSFNLDVRLVKAISKAKFAHPTIVQSAAIPLALEGKDILARARTGSGKTAAYILPILHGILQDISRDSSKKQGTRALILVPSAELCQQVYQHIQTLSEYTPEITCLTLSRSIPLQAQRKRISELPNIVVATPNQLIPHLREKNMDFRADPPLRWLVLDEVCIFKL
jgi:ATP-dependent RNA helicase DDX56/DBP9